MGAALGARPAESQEPTLPASQPGTTAPEQVPQHLRVSSGVSRGLLLKKVNPKYPDKARQEAIQGTVVLNASISKEGDIEDVTVASGDPVLAKAAVKAVKQWKYKPYIFRGQPVVVDTTIQVNFTLSGG